MRRIGREIVKGKTMHTGYGGKMNMGDTELVLKQWKIVQHYPYPNNPRARRNLSTLTYQAANILRHSKLQGILRNLFPVRLTEMIVEMDFRELTIEDLKRF